MQVAALEIDVTTAGQAAAAEKSAFEAILKEVDEDLEMVKPACWKSFFLCIFHRQFVFWMAHRPHTAARLCGYVWS